MMNQELFPNPTSVFLRQYFYAKKKTQNRQIDNIEIKITKKTIFPIIKSKTKESIIQKSNIDEFIRDCKEISSIIYYKYDLKKTFQLDLEVYQMCLQKIDQTGLSRENKYMIHCLLDSLKDYTENIIQISKREKELENISKHLDYADFKRSLYGSMLAFICIMIGILATPTIKIRTDILTKLINEGFNFASNLDSYTDTLDILTNPDELELLKKSELDIK